MSCVSRYQTKCLSFVPRIRSFPFFLFLTPFGVCAVQRFNLILRYCGRWIPLGFRFLKPENVEVSFAPQTVEAIRIMGLGQYLQRP